MMFKKLTYLMYIVLVLVPAYSGWGATRIIVVTDDPSTEAGLEPFLREILGNDIAVEIEDAKYRDPLSAAAKANLSSADLIIVSRQTNSGDYDAEISFWNGLETPILMNSAYLSRENRWQWLQGDQHDADALTHVTVIDEDNLIFTDVTIKDGQVEIFPNAIDNTDVSDQGSAGNGTLIATPAGVSDVMIASWEPGVEYYPGSGQVAGGPRIAFLMLRPHQYFPTLTDDGKKMLGNAVLILLGILAGEPVATEPIPADTETDVSREVILAWTPGESISTHDVYFGTSFSDVKDASRANTLGVLLGQDQGANTYDPVGRLDFGQTYYWRIDEVGAPPASTIFKGNVWSFTVEPYSYEVKNIVATASSSNSPDEGPVNTVNGSGLDGTDQHSTGEMEMWLSAAEPAGAWIQYEFDKVYKLHEMWVWNYNVAFESVLGYGFKDVVMEYSENAVDWATLEGIPEFVQGPGSPAYTPETIVDFGGTAVKYVRLTAASNWSTLGLEQFGLSEVRFLHIPVRAREPFPDLQASDVAVDVTLRWRMGREAARHSVYLGTDEQAVIDGSAPAMTVSEANYTPSVGLDLASTYYWRIDEVNDLETPGTWPGDIWSFSTQEFLVVDDFEAYNDIDEGQEGRNPVYVTWIDGLDNPSANGSTIGYLEAFQPSMETLIVHGGSQSVPLTYNNSVASSSEVTVDPANLPIGRDWTVGSPQALVLWFHGNPANAVTEQMYVRINDVKVTYPGSAADVAEPRWKQWNIDLTALGISPGSVTQLGIGFERTGTNGGTGTVFIDDILLYRLAPEIVVPSEEIWIEAEAADTITEPMKIYDDPAASGGRYIGTTDDISNSSNSPPAPAGTASYTFTAGGGTYKISGRINIPSGNNSFWVRIQGATIPAETEIDSSGWVRWNDPPDAPNWFWNDVFSDDDNEDATVLFTMPAGTYTLEIAYRETGAMLDAIVISRID
jgi:hypothetical protein